MTKQQPTPEEKLIGKIEKLKKEYEDQIEEAWEIAKRSVENAPDDMKLIMLGKCLGKKEMLKDIEKRTKDEFTRRLVDREVSYAKYMKTKKKHVKFSLDVLYAKVDAIDQVLILLKQTLKTHALVERKNLLTKKDYDTDHFGNLMIKWRQDKTQKKLKALKGKGD